jgi:predicted DNA-binding transcriptional regulator AlpA
MEIADNNTEVRSREAVLALLSSRFQIDALLVPVPKLARALGLSPSTVYAYMRQGTFFLPFRMVNTTPMVRLDDLVDWYLREDTVAA